MLYNNAQGGYVEDCETEGGIVRVSLGLRHGKATMCEEWCGYVAENG